MSISPILVGAGLGLGAFLVGFATGAVIVIGAAGAFVTQLTLNKKART